MILSSYFSILFLELTHPMILLILNSKIHLVTSSFFAFRMCHRPPVNQNPEIPGRSKKRFLILSKS